MVKWIEDIIESLPNVYGELARTYLPAIKQTPKVEVIRWADCLIAYGGKIPTAVTRKTKLMIPEVKVDQKRLNKILKALNKHHEVKVNLGRHILRMIIVIGIDRIYKEG